MFLRLSFLADGLGQPVAGELAAETPQGQVAVERRSRQGHDRVVRREDDPTPARPVVQCLAAEASLVERREHRIEVAGPARAQITQEVVDRGGPHRELENPLRPVHRLADSRPT